MRRATTLVDHWRVAKTGGLSQFAAAELLLTAGTLSGWVASTRHIDGGQNCAERLLSGAIALFDHLGEKARSGEGRVSWVTVTTARDCSICPHHAALFLK